MIELSQVETILHSIFKDGFNINGTNISCKSPTQVTIKSNDDNSINIDFHDNLPLATIKKLISISVQVEGIVFKKDSGTIKIKYFPDIHFNYATESKAIGAYDIDNVDFLEIESDIAKEYDDDNRQKLANKCLQYAKEWATIASYGGVSFRDCDFNQQKKLKTQCKQFVRESVLNDEEVRYGSVILTFILIQVILPIIIKWVVEKLFKRLSN